MVAVQARLSSQQLFRVGTVTTDEDDNPTLVGYGTPTSSGAAGGTTLIDISGAAKSGTADLFNGRYWVRIVASTLTRQWARIVDDDGAGTLTLEGAGFTAQVTTAHFYEIWRLPDTVIVCTGAGSTSTIVDSDRDEAESFWNRWYALAISGANIGEVRRVNSFATSSGTFTITGTLFTNAWAVGDVVLLRRYVEVGNFSPGYSEPIHERLSQRINWAIGDGRVGNQGPGPLTFDVWVHGSGVVTGANVAAITGAVNPLLLAAGLVEVRDLTSAISGSASTTTVLDITTGKHENFTIGGMVVVQGNGTFITAKTDGGVGVDQLTVSPPLPAAPGNAVSVYATTMYRKSIDGDTRACTIDFEQDGIRHMFFGCKGNVEFVEGSPCLFKFTLQYQLYVRQLESQNALENNTDPYTTVEAVLEGDKRAYKLPAASPGTDATKIDCGALTASPDTVVSPRPVSGRYSINGRSGLQVISEKGGMAFDQLYYSDGTELDLEVEWQLRTAKTYAMIYNSHSRTVGIRIPNGRAVEAPHPKDVNGMIGVRYVIAAYDAGMVSDPTAGLQKLPDWSLHLF